MIKIQNLFKSYGNQGILNNLNLTLREGEIHGIVGENGAGKTTLFKCIAGLENYEGHIMYDNKSLKNYLGYLPTDPFFLSKITGYEYLQLVSSARNLKLANFEVHNIFDLPLKQYAENYSTGMKKKLAITGLLIQKNEIFILDEPFNGVDIHSNIIIREVLLKLKDLNKIILLSSHIFSTLNDTCDYVHYLKNSFIKYSLGKGDFEKIEEEMKGESIGNKIQNLFI